MIDYIIFEHIYFRKKEHLWLCFNMDDEELGFLKLEKVGMHMHWCWYQFDGIRMSGGCLENVRDMQKKLWKERYEHD